MGFELDKLGTWSDEVEFKVEAERLQAYAEATNDPIEAHRKGDVAPPVFAVVPVWESLGASISRVVSDDILPMVVHGEQDIFFHRPITPGMVLRSTAAPVGVQVKPAGTTVTARVECRDDEGALVNEQYMTAFFRGFSEGEGAGEAPPDHRFPEERRGDEPFAEVVQQIDEDQTFRYADASGDRMPIHLDEDFAKNVGLPGIIIHGLCTMAFTSHALLESAAGGDTARLKRLAVRFSKPVLPGQAITTRIWEHGEQAGTNRYVYETSNPDGDVVIKDGLAEVS